MSSFWRRKDGRNGNGSGKIRIEKQMSAVGFLTLECESETNLSIGSVLQLLNNPSSPSSSPSEVREVDSCASSSSTTSPESSTNRDFFTKEGIAKMLKEKLLPKYERFSSIPNKKNGMWSQRQELAIENEEPPEGKKEREQDDQAQDQVDTYNTRQMDINAHIHTLSVPVPKNENGYAVDPKDALCAKLGKIFSRNLNPDIPLWEVYLIKDWIQPALFWRIHHCVGDGQSIATALLSISDANMEEMENELLGSIPKPSFIAQVWFYLWIFFGAFGVFLRWAYMQFFFPRPPPLFRGENVSREKTVAFDGESIEVSRALAVAKYHRVTFNDLMLTCMAGAIGRMLREKKLGAVEFPIGMPVNLRPTPFPKETGNVIGSYSLYLPTWQKDPVKRLKIVHSRMSTVKSLPEQYVTFGLSKICALLPGAISSAFFKQLASHLGAVITNVRGPEQEFGYEGNRVSALIGFVPPPVGVRLGFGVATYSGKVMLTVSADANLTSDLGQLLTDFIREFVDCEQGIVE